MIDVSLRQVIEKDIRLLLRHSGSLELLLRFGVMVERLGFRLCSYSFAEGLCMAISKLIAPVNVTCAIWFLVY